MLKKVSSRPPPKPESAGSYVVVASCYNARYVDALVQSVSRELRAGGAGVVEVVRVPGAFEIPVVAAAVARRAKDPPVAIVCLGVILQGETSHARHIGDAVSLGLVQLQLARSIPVIHGVYVFETEAQARVRCLGRTHNRGVELARTALAMSEVMRSLAR
jgi:6,7-dimethyl-8-ribityllumazine synthase